MERQDRHSHRKSAGPHRGCPGLGLQPPGEILLAVYQNHGWELWDSSTGEPIGGEVQLDSQALASGFEPDGKTLRILTKDDQLFQEPMEWVDPHSNPDKLLLTTEIAGRTRVNPQGSLEAVTADQWVRLWVQYRKESK